ncbi:pentapeptide repeat-containing protein [Coleofasciculus chthonoplastes]|uniref:pentapeptide repeat-containing protein n=1 Tax=Coleofasciculus chthonoplastes TaxID=64178 RepID=UPI0032F1BBE4
MSAYIGWRAIKGDEREAWIWGIAIDFAATGGTSFRRADLTDANFTSAKLKSTDLRQATLIRTCFHKTQKLDRVRPGMTYIKDAQVRQLLITRKGQAQNFDRKNLRGVNLQVANLADASFIGADLSQASLQDTNLSRAKLVQTQLDYTDLTGATLTGACIEDWGITPETQLNGIQCEYVFMRLADNLDPNPRRKPDDWNKTFEDGEFADFIAPMVQTLDLYHNQVDDPRLIAMAFQQLTETHPEAELDIVSIEKRGKHRDKVLIRAETSPQANHSELHHDYFTTYNELQALSPAALQQLLAEKDGQVKRLTGLVEAAIKRPGISAQTYYSQGDTMSENSEIKVSAGGSVGAVGGGDVSNPGVMNLGEISGSVSNSLNQLPESPEPDKPGIKELLAQLQGAIEAESNLDEEDKAEALEQVKTLAEAGKNPQEKGNQKTAKRATTMLKGIIVGLPTAATLFEAWNKVQPLITKLFGL